MPRTARLIAPLIGVVAALAFAAAPASATICPGGNTGNPLADYCVNTANWSTLIGADLPEAWYRLNDASGSDVMLDSSPKLHHGEYKNGQDSGPTGISADNDKSRDFWGENGYGFANGIPAPNRSGSFRYSSWTVEAWFYQADTDAPSPSTHDDGTIMDFGRGPSIYILNGLIRCTNGDDTVTAPTLYQDEKWYMVVCRKNGRHLDLFVQASPGAPTPFNYTPAASGFTTYLPEGSPTFYVGYGAHAPWFNGAIDEVMLFTYALTDDQIANHFYADPAPSDTHVGKPAAPSTGGGGSSGGGSSSGGGGNSGGSGGGSFSDDSKNPTHKPTTNTAKAKQLAAAKKEVKRLTGVLAKLKKQFGALKYHHASMKTLMKAKSKVKTAEAQLKKAKAKVKALS